MTEHPCPDCGRPLRLVYDRPGIPREYLCDVALRGLREGKIGGKYRHKAAWVYKEITECAKN